VYSPPATKLPSFNAASTASPSKLKIFVDPNGDGTVNEEVDDEDVPEEELEQMIQDLEQPNFKLIEQSLRNNKNTDMI